MVSIDLGVVSDLRPEPAPSVPRPPRTRRAIGAVLCLVLTGALLGGSARPAANVLPEVRVPMKPADAFFLAGDRLYVVSPQTGASGPTNRTISAYTAPGGEPVWQRSLMLDGVINGITAAGDGLLLHLSSADYTERMLLLDAGTAVPRWSVEAAWPLLFDGDTMVISSAGDALTWRAVRIATGEQLWRREFPAGAFLLWASSGDGQTVVALPDDRIELWDLRANRLLAGTRVPDTESVTVTDGVVLAMTYGVGGVDVVAYSRADLRRLWQREFPRGLLHTAGCGVQIICTSDEERERMVGIDPATGDRIWEQPAFGWYTEIGPMLLAEGDIRHEGGGTVVDSGPIVAMDSRTGTTIRDFGRWRRIRHEEVPAARRTIVAHFDPLANTALVAEIDLDRMALRVLGRVRGVGPDCTVQRTVMTCMMLDNSVGMWNLPVAS
ncbi:outer membrane protein assembly factor BamB family protein [Catenuloplanes indicus]|uniref:Pyrrolo-quinoline quinone repeat domain-containing protein n=1 Tax=Catenuloplanes indicus TaxID=137267 RepID=A0AAE3W485_9ACTN|nr:PQQ-binding-like beta-propeller repeat protein [Catenuloplanes indicus]MDQ0369276.1 hypothetical protein [Catenuloplanes indicus]